MAGESLRIEGIEVYLDRRGQRQLLANSPEARVEHGGKGEVRVAGRVRGPEFDPDSRPITAAGSRYPNQRRTVHLGPADRHRGLEARHETLVGVDEWRHQRAERTGMRQLAGDEVLGDGRQVILVRSVIKGVGVLAQVGEDLMGMHPGAGGTEDRLGHEGGEQSPTLRHRLDSMLERDELVRALQRVVEGEVQLILSGRDFVVAGVDGDAQAVKGGYDLLPDFAAGVNPVV